MEWTAFKWRYGYVLVPHQGKSDKPKKVIPPESYLRKARTRYDEDKPRGIIWVCHRNGKRVNSYRTAWLKALRDAGLADSGIRFYDIRHISATEMLAHGADLAAVAAPLGQSEIDFPLVFVQCFKRLIHEISVEACLRACGPWSSGYNTGEGRRTKPLSPMRFSLAEAEPGKT